MGALPGVAMKPPVVAIYLAYVPIAEPSSDAGNLTALSEARPSGTTWGIRKISSGAQVVLAEIGGIGSGSV
jgi:ABC-type taurine transport system substrate-binding protein